MVSCQFFHQNIVSNYLKVALYLPGIPPTYPPFPTLSFCNLLYRIPSPLFLSGGNLASSSSVFWVSYKCPLCAPFVALLSKSLNSTKIVHLNPYLTRVYRSHFYDRSPYKQEVASSTLAPPSPKTSFFTMKMRFLCFYTSPNYSTYAFRRQSGV